MTRQISNDKLASLSKTYLADFIGNICYCKSLKSLSNLTLRNIPFGSELKNLKSIQPSQDITITKVPTINQTYYDCWSRKYAIELRESVQRILIFEVNNQDFHYPAESIFIDRYSLQKIYGGTLKRQTLPLSPHERFSKAKGISNWISQQQINPLSEFVDISINSIFQSFN